MVEQEQLHVGGLVLLDFLLLVVDTFLLDLLTAIFNFTFSYLGMITSKLFQSLFLNCCLVLVEHLRSHGACWSSGKPIGGYPKEVSMILMTEGSCYREEKSYSHKAGGGLEQGRLEQLYGNPPPKETCQAGRQFQRCVSNLGSI